jgi:hypothetical protein
MYAYMRGLGLLTLALFISSFIIGQDANNLALDATVKDQDGGKLPGVDIVVIQDGALVSKVKTRSNGRFDLLLDFDHEYIIEANRPGFVSKRMYVNTNNVPEDEQLWGYEYGGFAIDLFKNIEGVDFSILEKPVAKIYYDPNVQNFTYDKVYTKQIKAQLDELLEEYERTEKMQEQILAQKEKDYLLAIKDAENALADGDLLIAKENYLAAASLKPDESTPKKKLQEIESKINAESNTEEKYMSLLASADQLYAEEKFEKAKALYNEASNLKPEEIYPKTKAKESAKLAVELKDKLAVEALLAGKDRRYNEEISKADKEFTSGNFLNSKAYYQNAIGLKPDEQYPKDQIQAADIKISEMRAASEKEKELAIIVERYNAQIAKADAAYDSKNLENALAGYNEALNIKNDEEYPRKQILKIEEQLAEIARNAQTEKINQEKQRSYLAAIKEADDLLAKNLLVEAKSSYEEALRVKPDESYPEAQIKLIAERVALEKEQAMRNENLKAENEAFEKKLADANDRFNQNKFEEAITIYEEALKLRPSDQSIKDKIADAKVLISKNERDAKYNEVVAEADRLFSQNKLAEAKTKYEQAIEILDSDKYPLQQISKIEQLLKDQIARNEQDEITREREEKYSELIRVADEAFRNEEFKSAINSYKEAQTYTDDPKYAIDQIELSNKRIQELEKSKAESELVAQNQAEYEKAIQLADMQFENKEFDKAVTTYNLAASILTDQSYPKEQITRIEGILKEKSENEALLAEQREEDKRNAKQKAAYDDAISMADAYMDSEDYLNAKLKYGEAKEIDPSQSYATNQISAIDQLLLEMKATAKAEEDQRNAYNQLLSDGDQAVMNKNWTKARESFESALKIYADEKIPQARLEEIDILEQKQLDEQKNELFKQHIAKADDAFMKGDLDEAKLYYNKALEIFPEDAFALARIKKISEIQNAESETKIVVEDKERSMVEENYDEGNAKVTIRKVTIGDRTEIYKRVVHSWGGKYYFLNDLPISELIWNRDSNN